MRLHTALAFLLSFAVSAFGQTITVSPSSVLAGQSVTVKVKDMNCLAGKATALIDDTEIRATIGNDETSWFVMLPESLSPKRYDFKMNCGDTTSRVVGLEILKPPDAEAICATNLTPKEGAPADGKCDPKNRWNVRVGDRISVQVRNFKDPGKPIHLFVAGIELKNVILAHSAVKGADVFDGWLDFDNTDPNNRKAWVQMLRTARDNEFLDVSVGPEGGPPLPGTAKIELNLYPVFYAWFAIVLVALLAAALFLLGMFSGLLRDQKEKDGVDPPFSLAKHQMAVWLLVVISAYLFVSLITGTSASTSPTALILIGISGATGLSAIVIDKSKLDGAKSNHESLQAEQKALRQQLEDPAAGLKAQLSKLNPGAPDVIQLSALIATTTKRLSEVDTQLAEPIKVPVQHQSWISDLLSDENGISFHRLQIFVWTIVLVCAFIRAVWRDLAMPEFDATTLGLMGISSGTYIGFKFPEKK